MAWAVAVVIELAPILAAKVVGAVQIATVVSAVPIAVGVAVAVPTAVVPFVAAASTRFVEVSVAVEEQQLAQHELCDRCEYAARYTTLRGSPTR